MDSKHSKIPHNLSKTLAIPFVLYTPESGFQIAEEASEFLATLTQTVSVVAVCGKYRTGKSYLMNKLFLNPDSRAEEPKVAEKGFPVGPTI
jgi:hypothetical protein